MKKEICVVTATRAEYGLLRSLIFQLKQEAEFDVKVVVTGMHLSPEFGLTYKEIEKDQIKIDKKIEMLLSADTPSSISKSMGMAMIGFADYFSDHSFDAIILLGDRYETLAVACAAMNEQIPIVHLYGGETTEGAVDEGIRHAITKLSYLHFTSTESYRKRVIQMGESPERVFCVGAVGVENALHMELLPKQELENQLNINLNHPYAIVTFHPVTLENQSADTQTRELLNAIGEFSDWDFIVTKANADKDGRIINKLFDEYAMEHKNVHVYSSLGMKRYLSAMKYCNLVIGNSSSGLLEAPTFHIPTVNIGDRQLGRIKADSVIDCLPEKNAIVEAIRKSNTLGFQEKLKNVQNPYGDGNTSEKIVQILKEKLCDSEVNLKKKFYNLDF